MTAPALLLAHGATGSLADNYGPVRERLEHGRTVLGADYPGSGDAPRSGEPLELDSLADLLVAEADAAGVERFAVSGYSLGTAVAARIATRHPGRVTAVVLTAPFARLDNRTLLHVRQWKHLYETGDRLALGRHMLPLALGPAALEAIAPADLDAAALATGESAPPGTAEQVDLVARADVRDDLPRIAVPTLVVVTTEDRLVPVPLQRAVAAAVPGARTAGLATGHLPFAEAPEEWAGLITSFLDEVAGG
ncbi:alpha/beta fold hydrolase [Streptomyces sp. NPDC001941]|uniref:alpha/beta fold hydrolase n=1 Tax=Streptomyces sp. NPDC001941 TaxID=3154659 RepID=UPI003319C6D3